MRSYEFEKVVRGRRYRLKLLVSDAGERHTKYHFIRTPDDKRNHWVEVSNRSRNLHAMLRDAFRNEIESSH